jgi:hypothetical protein
MNIGYALFWAWILGLNVSCRSVNEGRLSLVGGSPVSDVKALASVMIWTTQDIALDDGYCTGSKISETMILTAAHCVLIQKPLEGERYLGPWQPMKSMQPGESLRYSFSNDLNSESSIEDQLIIEALHLPELVRNCLDNPQLSLVDCQNRTPHPDVAVIEVRHTGVRDFSRHPAARIAQQEVLSSKDIVLTGFGSEGRVNPLKPRLKQGKARVATWFALLLALKTTDAVDDGYPDQDYFFGTVRDVDDPRAVNLGSGDSGGPVLDDITKEIVGVNSDAHCPVGNPDCELTNNSIFARVNRGSSHGVGEWLQNILSR